MFKIFKKVTSFKNNCYCSICKRNVDKVKILNAQNLKICNDCIQLAGGNSNINYNTDKYPDICKKIYNNPYITKYKLKKFNDFLKLYKYGGVEPKFFENIYIKHKTTTYTNDFVVFDVETTGLEPAVDRIIEIGAFKYKNNKKIDKFHMLVNPNILLDSEIMQLTGITDKSLIDKLTIDKVLPLFFEFIEDYTLIAHNASFDIKMLACECYRNNIKMCDNKVIDTLSLSKKVISKEKIENYKLETIKDYLGLNYNSHRALDGCEVCARIFQMYIEKSKKDI